MRATEIEGEIPPYFAAGKAVVNFYLRASDSFHWTLFCVRDEPT